MNDVMSFLERIKLRPNHTSMKLIRDLTHSILKMNFDGDIVMILPTYETFMAVAAAGNILGKKVYYVDYAQSSMGIASGYAFQHKLYNCYFVYCDYENTFCEDVLSRKCEFGNVGCIIFEAISNTIPETEGAVKLAIEIGAKDFMVFINYGHCCKDHGDAIRRFIKSSPIEIVKYIGEKTNWKPLFEGSSVDYEAVIVKYVG